MFLFRKEKFVLILIIVFCEFPRNLNSEEVKNISEKKINNDPSTLTAQELQKNEEKINEVSKQVNQELPKEENDLKTTDDEECELELLDEIKAEVTSFDSESTEKSVLTMQDVRRRGFDGNKYTVEDLIDQTLADNYSKVLKIAITNEDINRNLKKMNLTEKDIKAIAENWDYPDANAFFEDLKKTYRANGALKFEIESQMSVSEDEIKLEYDADPIHQEALYVIETSFVTFENQEKENLKNELVQYSQGKISKPKNLFWEVPTKIVESEIPQENKFIIDLKMGEIYIKELSDGFLIFKLQKKQAACLVPLEDRRKEIVAKLQKQKYPNAYKSVIERLRSQSIVTRPDQQFSVPCNVNELDIKKS